MRNGWLDPDQIETRVYDSGARAVPVPQPRGYGDDERAGHSVSAAAAEIYTRPVEKRREDMPLVTPITLGLAALCVVVGVTIGSMIGFSAETKADAAPVAAQPAPAATVTAIAPPPAPAPPNTLRVESDPAGATVMFVSEGAATLVGTTPIDTTLDPSRSYDVLITLANHASKIEHVTPSSNHHLTVALAPTAR